MDIGKKKPIDQNHQALENKKQKLNLLHHHLLISKVATITQKKIKTIIMIRYLFQMVLILMLNMVDDQVLLIIIQMIFQMNAQEQAILIICKTLLQRYKKNLYHKVLFKQNADLMDNNHISWQMKEMPILQYHMIIHIPKTFNRAKNNKVLSME